MYLKKRLNFEEGMTDFFTITLIGLAMSMCVMMFGLLQEPRKRLPNKHETSQLIRERHAALIAPSRLGCSRQPLLTQPPKLTQI